MDGFSERGGSDVANRNTQFTPLLRALLAGGGGPTPKNRTIAAWSTARTPINRGPPHERHSRPFSRYRGKKVSQKTVTIILDPDTRTADLYRLDCFNKRVEWNLLTKISYLTSCMY